MACRNTVSVCTHTPRTQIMEIKPWTNQETLLQKEGFCINALFFLKQFSCWKHVDKLGNTVFAAKMLIPNLSENFCFLGSKFCFCSNVS